MNKIITTLKKILSICFVKLKKIYNNFTPSHNGSGRDFKYKFTFILPFILDKLNTENVSSKGVILDFGKDSDPLLNYAFSMFILSSIVLICFINIIGFIISLYLLDKYDVESKYPKLIKYINFFKKTSEINIIIEIFVALIFLIAILALNLFLLTTLLFK